MSWPTFADIGPTSGRSFCAIWESTSRTAAVTVTKIAGYVRVRILMNRSLFRIFSLMVSECRVKMWRSKTGKSGASSVKLCSIRPTTEAFTENVHRCHLQVAIWKAALLQSPPEMDSTKYGWEIDHLGILVRPTVPSGTLSDVLQLIHCNGKASECRTAACSCTKMGCTIFCLCEGAEACRNPLTRSQTDDESEKTIEDPDDNDM